MRWEFGWDSDQRKRTVSKVLLVSYFAALQRKLYSDEWIVWFFCYYAFGLYSYQHKHVLILLHSHFTHTMRIHRKTIHRVIAYGQNKKKKKITREANMEESHANFRRPNYVLKSREKKVSTKRKKQQISLWMNLCVRNASTHLHSSNRSHANETQINNNMNNVHFGNLST